MTTATITHEGETIHVPIKNISLPAGHRFLAPGEVPEDLFTQDDLDEKVKDRVEREKEKEYEDHVELEDGDVVLSGEEAAKLKERDLLVAEDDEITVNTQTFDDTKSKAEKADALERKEQHRKVAEAAGITGFDAFEGLVNGEQFEVEEGGEDEDATVTVVHEEDGEEKRTPLAEYERFKPYHAALFGESQEQQQKSAGPSYPKQTPAGKNKKTSGDDDPVGALSARRTSVAVGRLRLLKRTSALCRTVLH